MHKIDKFSLDNVFVVDKIIEIENKIKIRKNLKNLRKNLGRKISIIRDLSLFSISRTLSYMRTESNEKFRFREKYPSKNRKIQNLALLLKTVHKIDKFLLDTVFPVDNILDHENRLKSRIKISTKFQKKVNNRFYETSKHEILLKTTIT